jgi:hypothetical protein
MAKWRRLAKQSRLAARLHCNAENIDNVLAGNDFPIVHTARAFDPTAQQLPNKKDGKSRGPSTSGRTINA